MSTVTSSVAVACNSSLLHIKSSSRRSSYRPASTLDISGGLANQTGTCHFLGNPRLQSFYTSLLVVQNGSKNTKMDMKVNNDYNLPDVPQLPSNSDPGSWKLWLVGVFMTVIIPFWRNKWSPLQKLQQKVEQVVDTAQAVTDMVEDVVEEVEKVADDLGNRLPEGKLQDAAEYIEKLAGKAAENIDRVEDVLDKVEEVENKLEDFLEEQMKEEKEAKNDDKKETKGENDDKKETKTNEEKSVTSA